MVIYLQYFIFIMTKKRNRISKNLFHQTRCRLSSNFETCVFSFKQAAADINTGGQISGRFLLFVLLLYVSYREFKRKSATVDRY